MNLGCKVNRVEADGFERGCSQNAAVPVAEAAADLVVNTCTVTGEAEKKTRKAVRHALSTNGCRRVVVTGCASEISSETFATMDDRVPWLYPWRRRGSLSQRSGNELAASVVLTKRLNLSQH